MQKNLLSSVEILKNLNENNFENFDFLFLGSEIIQSRFAIELQWYTSLRSSWFLDVKISEVEMVEHFYPYRHHSFSRFNRIAS